MSDQEYQQWYDEHAWNPSRYDNLTIESDLSPADWLEPLLVPGSFEVWMTAPRGYETYARIFFPFIRTALDPNGEWFEKQIRWTDLATDNGKAVHPLMEQETIVWTSDGAFERDQCYPKLSAEQFEALMPVLGRHTSSTDGWLLLWEGFGDLNDQVFNPRVPKASHDMRNFYLLRGPLTSYAQFSDDPSYWWPDDRSWCLCTDTDFAWSYLAGSRECIDEVLGIPVMDAVETRPENPARSGMDTINDPDGVVPRLP
jgi:hypothetical protein